MRRRCGIGSSACVDRIVWFSHATALISIDVAAMCAEMQLHLYVAPMRRVLDIHGNAIRA